jgi:hypothetical protein
MLQHIFFWEFSLSQNKKKLTDEQYLETHKKIYGVPHAEKEENKNKE